MIERPETTQLRLRILVVLAVGMLGVLLELILIGHVEDLYQWTPLVLLGLGASTTAVRLTVPSDLTVGVLNGAMAACVLGGVAGVVLHFQGNAAFEREIFPDMGGLELIRESLTGATPALAPGSMILLGVLGLVANHPYSIPSNSLQES